METTQTTTSTTTTQATAPNTAILKLETAPTQATPTQTKTLRNSDVTVPKEKRAFLTYPSKGLAPCALEETEDSITLIFNTTGLEQSESIQEKPHWEQLRFLSNCATLITLDTEYDFPLSPDNLLIDINLTPHLLIRDAKKPTNDTTHPSFLDRYKALIGSILLPKYKYEDYIQGGQDLYKKHKQLSSLTTLETVEEIQAALLKDYRRQIWETTTTQKLVPKRNIWLSRIAIPLLTLSLLASIFLVIRARLIDIPFRENLITAGTAYITGNHLGVQQALRSHSVASLPVETRHILSRSYVSTEALTETQRENILIGLAPITNPMLFDYWILLGRLYFAEAVDIARRLGDDELLLFAYLKQEVFARNDLSLPGEERQELLSYLERNITNLNRIRDEAVQEIFGTGS